MHTSVLLILVVCQEICLQYNDKISDCVLHLTCLQQGTQKLQQRLWVHCSWCAFTLFAAAIPTEHLRCNVGQSGSASANYSNRTGGNAC